MFFFCSDLILKGCYFHFAQAIFRKIVQFTLKRDYFVKANSGARVLMKWLMSLVLLPAPLMKPTFYAVFDKIKENNRTNLIKLFKYYENNWINGQNWSVNDICQWGCKVRTNNDAERFHMKLMARVKRTSVNFYELVNILGVIAENLVYDAKMFALSLINRKPRPSIISFVKLLEDVSQKLKDQCISPFEFLNKLTAANVDNQLVDKSWGLDHSRVDLRPESEEHDSDAP